MSKVTFRKLDLLKVRAELKEHVRTLLAREPGIQRIVLFGSLAKGTFTGSSDADLLIIVDRSDQPFLQRLPRFMSTSLSVPVDVFVYTADEVEQAEAEGIGLVCEALRTGIVLFDANAGPTMSGERPRRV